ncbi:Uracil DNA glycosylase superfamily protein [Prevotella sp. khp1]|uniref:hypothetical protein n=1 Tax=Prevotellaceae TaxID=171552 RepID=UPI000889757A|nr:MULTISPECIES: hypothetical protein [Prevotellaceae]QVJ81838.1 hypothetical protein J4031_05580 [Xylanibacter ruminicola]SDQ75609.1 Uracil DNA glycosylase superfamily protein [Prevotella sp. khp1]
MNIKEKLNDWAKETVEVYKKQSTEIGFYTQTPLSIFLKDNIQKPDLLILGINPGSGGGIRRNTGTELLKGNPCFEGMDSERIIKNMSEEKDNNKNRKGWALWHRVNNMLKFSNNEDHKKILRNLDRFVLSNMIFFGTEKENQIPNIKREECAKQTIELISILQPKVVLLLGSQSRKLFDRVSENKLEVLVPNSMYHCMSGKSHVLAIKHTAYYYSSIEMELIGKTIGFILDHQDKTINSESIVESSLKDDIIRFEQAQRTIQIPSDNSLYYLKKKIRAKGCNKGIDNNGYLIYEYYCNNAFKEFIKENGTVSIGIFYQNKQCCFSVMTKGNHPEDLLKKVQETCDELKVFKNDSKDCFVSDIETDDVKIVEFFNVLLAKIKKYRETDCPK